jgi:hypothetical protein
MFYFFILGMMASSGIWNLRCPNPVYLEKDMRDFGPQLSRPKRKSKTLPKIRIGDETNFDSSYWSGVSSKEETLWNLIKCIGYDVLCKTPSFFGDILEAIGDELPPDHSLSQFLLLFSKGMNVKENIKTCVSSKYWNDNRLIEAGHYFQLPYKFTNENMYRVVVQRFWLYVRRLSFSDLIWFDEIMRKVQASHDNAQYRAYLCTTEDAHM